MTLPMLLGQPNSKMCDINVPEDSVHSHWEEDTDSQKHPEQNMQDHSDICADSL